MVAGVGSPEDEPTDDQLLIAYNRGEQRAFDLLYARYRHPLYGYLYRHLNCETQAGELFQDVWLRVIASSSRFENRGRFRSWIFTLAHNRLVDFYRGSEKRVTEPRQTISPVARHPTPRLVGERPSRA